MVKRSILTSRMRRFEEKKLRTRLLLAILGSVTLIIFVVVFGFKLLIGFAGFVDSSRGKDTTPTTNQIALVLPPYLDPLPLATSSGKLIITGRGQRNSMITLYINDSESKKTRIADDGTFIISSITLPEGDQTIKAKAQDEHGKFSEFSNTVRTSIMRHPPVLDVTKPTDNQSVSGDNNLLPVEGKTEEDTDIRVNDRFVVVKSDNTFSYPYPLAEGDNTLVIKAIDRAGNSTEITRKVTYHK